METLSWLCLLLPLAGVTLLALGGTRITRQTAAWLGTGFAFASFICAAVVFFSILGEGESSRSHVYTLYTWAGSAHFHVPLGILVDQLSVVEMLIVSGVGALIVMYSVGYMDGDPKQRRFFAYLDLFLFSMLLLVMADNFVLLLAGWGLVGLSSYLLIGFWHERKEPVDVELSLAAGHRDDDPQADHDLGRGDAHHDQCEDLPGVVAPVAREGDQGQVARVQHQLDREQQDQRAAPREDAEQPDAEDDGGHRDEVLDAYMHRDLTTPPPRAARASPGRRSRRPSRRPAARAPVGAPARAGMRPARRCVGSACESRG